MIERRIGGGRLGQPGQEGTLARRQLAHALAEEGARGGLDPESAVAEVDLVQVDLEDAVLGVAALELHGQHCFLELALEAAIRREEEDLGELLGDGAASLDDPPAAEVLVDGAGDAHGVDAEVRVEARVLGGDDRLLEGGRHLAEGDEDAPLHVELRDELVGLVVDARSHAGLDALQLGHRG